MKERCVNKFREDGETFLFSFSKLTIHINLYMEVKKLMYKYLLRLTLLSSNSAI